MAKGAKGRSSSKNPELIPGVRRYGSAVQSHRSGNYFFAKKAVQIPKAAKKAVVKRDGRFYAADDVKVPLRSNRAAPKTARLRKSIQAGTVVIVLAGRFRGKRVIVLKQLASGLLLVTGPYKVNGVPLRRMNQAYVIATSTQVNVSTVDVSKIDDAFFAKAEEKKTKKDGEEFFAKNEKKSEVSAARKAAQSAVDAALKPVLKATPQLAEYLNAKFTLTRGQRPHLLKF